VKSSRCGFSSFILPCATAICDSSADSREDGAYPAAFVFAVGTFESCGLSGDASPPTAANIATAPTATGSKKALCFKRSSPSSGG
jgi:hypothetical protein